MKVLAIGATGFIGPHVVNQLVDLGHEVAVLHRGETDAPLPRRVRRIYGNRDALSDLRTDLTQFAPDVVLDVIPYTERQATELLQALRGLAARVVAVSSADVYRNYDGFRGKGTAPPDPVPLAEDAPLRERLYPYRDYDIPFQHRDEYDKILVERVILGQPDLPGTVLRLPAVYGPGDKQHRLRAYVRRMVDDRATILVGQQQASWRWTRGYVVNVAAAITLAVTNDSAAGRIYNLGEELTPTEREWIEWIGQAAGWPGEVVTVPDGRLPAHLKQPYDWSYHLATDTGRIRAELGYTEPISRLEALKQTVKWELSEPDESQQPNS